ncbi:hypothetical protein ACFQ4O_16760, partial [Methylopila musalis]
MRIIRSARLGLTAGTSDKVYEVDLVENDALQGEQRYLVNFRYGRRGATLREGSKTPAPVALASALLTFDSVVVSKVNGGYRRADEPDAAPAAFGEASSATAPTGRDAVLLGRLDGLLR